MIFNTEQLKLILTLVLYTNEFHYIMNFYLYYPKIKNITELK